MPTFSGEPGETEVNGEYRDFMYADSLVSPGPPAGGPAHSPGAAAPSLGAHLGPLSSPCALLELVERRALRKVVLAWGRGVRGHAFAGLHLLPRTQSQSQGYGSEASFRTRQSHAGGELSARHSLAAREEA